MDEDLDGLTREQLLAEAKRLRAGVRAHRDASGHDLCWHHPTLWSCSRAYIRSAAVASRAALNSASGHHSGQRSEFARSLPIR